MAQKIRTLVPYGTNWISSKTDGNQDRKPLTNLVPSLAELVPIWRLGPLQRGTSLMQRDLNAELVSLMAKKAAAERALAKAKQQA